MLLFTDSMEKLTSSQVVEKFPEFYGTRKFITAPTRPRHPSISSDRSIQSMPPVSFLENPF
jgi:hypothetical protein